MLEILTSGRVWGAIKVTSLVIDEGGLPRGKSIMVGDEQDPFLREVPDESSPPTKEE